MEMTTRIRESFDREWRFNEGDLPGAEAVACNDKAWRCLDLPHDWSIEGEFDEHTPAGGDGGFLPTGIGWYRKTFHVPQLMDNQKVFIEFDGIYMKGNVWVNGHDLGSHPYGYSSIHHDVTDYLKPCGEANVIAVRVDNSVQPHSRWYTGSGIYRHTWLLITHPVHVDRWGVRVTTPDISEALAQVALETTLLNHTDNSAAIIVRSEVFGPDGKRIGAAETPLQIAASRTEAVKQVVQVKAPSLWSDREPNMYQVRTVLLTKNHVAVDEVLTPFGIRKIEFDADQGFLLNDKRVKLNGVCLHHDGGCVGAAVPERVWERRLELLHRMGCNAIRMSHNPPAPELLDLCDRMGFLVMDEAFDEWKMCKGKNGIREYGYANYYDEWSETDLSLMIRRDRNHPSIVLWSVGNEILEQAIDEGSDMLKKLIDICRREDGTRPVTSGCHGIGHEPIDVKGAKEPFLEQLDVVGYNYADRWRERAETYYSDDRHRYPQRKFIGSENIGYGGVRGDYSLKRGEALPFPAPYHTRMITAERLWKFTRTYDYVAGDFMWTGIDYIGESNKWPYYQRCFGVIDTCGFPKDAYYFYQSQWTEQPMLHVFPHWNWQGREGSVIPVICFTNCDTVELFLNEKSFGVKGYRFPRFGMSERYGYYRDGVPFTTTSDLHLSWDVPYEPGTLRAVGVKGGVVVCEQVIGTTVAPAAIALECDRMILDADGSDVAHITVSILDRHGLKIPTADNEITFSVEGVGRLIGTDNGQPVCQAGFQSRVRRVFHGLCLAVVQANHTAGEIHVTASSAGLESCTLIIRTQASQ
jgi:beta-galactosidase